MTDADSLETKLTKTTLAYQDALQMNRLKAGFLGRIAHEIRSPLSSLMGLHQLIINDLCDNPEEERESIKQAYQYAQKLMAMIDQVIELSKLEIGRIDLEAQEFDLSELLEDVYQIMVLEAANKNLKLNLDKRGDNFIITTDKTRLTNILFYLLEVAIDASDGGSINLIVHDNQNSQQYLIKIEFISDDFSLELSPSHLHESQIPLEELKRLHILPEFSSSMKISLVEALSEIMKGEFKLEEGNNPQGEHIKELCLFLPVEIA